MGLFVLGLPALRAGLLLVLATTSQARPLSPLGKSMFWLSGNLHPCSMIDLFAVALLTGLVQLAQHISEAAVVVYGQCAPVNREIRGWFWRNLRLRCRRLMFCCGKWPANQFQFRQGDRECGTVLAPFEAKEINISCQLHSFLPRRFRLQVFVLCGALLFIWLLRRDARS